MTAKHQTTIKQVTDFYKNVCFSPDYDTVCGGYGVACSFCPVRLLRGKEVTNYE